MKRLMIDIETLGTKADALILSIAAVWFDCTGTGAEFYRAISLEQNGRSIDAATVIWWMKQNHAARDAMLIEARFPIEQALLEFAIFAEGADEYWCKGPSFDFPILDTALESMHIDRPWAEFWRQRDLRTLIAAGRMAGHEYQGRKPASHHALDDARQQAEEASHLIGWLTTANKYTERVAA